MVNSQIVKSIATEVVKLTHNGGRVVQNAERGSRNITAECRQLKNVLGVDSILQTRPNTIPISLKGLRLASGTRAVSQYTLKNGQKARIFKVSAEDKEMLEKVCADMQKYLDLHKIESEDVNENRFIIEKCFQILKEMTEKGIKEPKTHMYIAESNSKLCGILIGGLPKVTPKGAKVFSAREGALQTETELNWLATWPEGNGVGKCLFSEYIKTMKKDGFANMFIQSEIPAFTSASKFYERMGFKQVYKEIPDRPVSQIEYNGDVLDCLNLNNAEEMHDYLIRPMLGKRVSVQKIADKIIQDCQRETFLKPINSNNYVRELDITV